MDERYVIECPEQQFQHRQSFVKKNKSEIKQEKKMSKTESRFKSKLGKRIQLNNSTSKAKRKVFFFIEISESLRKFQHSASASNAVEKARAFFRSLELRHHSSASHSDHSSSSTSSSSRQYNSNSKNTNIHLSASSSSACSKAPLPSSLSSSSASSIIDDTQNTFSVVTTTQDSSFHPKQSSNCIATARIIRVINPKDTIVQDDQQIPSSYFSSSQIRLQKNLQPSELYFNQRNTQIEYSEFK